MNKPSKINNCHDTIHFIFNYSNQEATFLDVNIKMKENGELDASVHEKVTNCHQYVEFTPCHHLSCKQGIPYSRAKRYRRFEKYLGRLKEYFLTRNYPKHVIDEAVGQFLQ